MGIASDPLCLVGLDIVSIMIPERTTEHEFMSNFSSYLTALEWKNIAKAGASEEKLCEFYRYVNLNIVMILSKLLNKKGICTLTSHF